MQNLSVRAVLYALFYLITACQPSHQPEMKKLEDQNKRLIEVNDQLTAKLTLLYKLQGTKMNVAEVVIANGKTLTLGSFFKAESRSLVLYIPSNICGDCYSKVLQYLDLWLSQNSTLTNAQIVVIAGLSECRNLLRNKTNYPQHILCKPHKTSLFDSLTIDRPIILYTDSSLLVKSVYLVDNNDFGDLADFLSPK
jgi:hypothetical protein